MPLLLLHPAAVLAGGTDTSGTPQDESRIRRLLLHKMTSAVVAQHPWQAGETISLRVFQDGEENSSPEPVASALREAGYTPSLRTGSGRETSPRLDVVVTSMSAAFEPVGSEPGVFRRTVTASAEFSARTASNDVVYRAARTEQHQDTLRAPDGGLLQDSEALHGQRGGPLDRIVAPLVIIGAAGISVFLFFHIRS